MLSAGWENASRGRRGAFGPTDQRQTLQISRFYLVTVVVTIRGKVDTAETGDGDFKLFVVAPLDKIDRFLTLSSLGNLNKLTAPLPCSLWLTVKMQELASYKLCKRCYSKLKSEWTKHLS